MDAKLQNVYAQVLLDNFISVVKQNVLFQAQLETSKTEVDDVNEIKRRLQELSARNEELQKSFQAKDSIISEKEKIINTLSFERDNLKVIVNSKDTQVNSLNSVVQEKNRLQNAVNDYMRQLDEARKEIVKVKSDSQEALLQNSNRIEELNKYILRLESAVPAAKLKKVRLGENVQPESPEIISNEENDLVKSGGTF